MAQGALKNSGNLSSDFPAAADCCQEGEEVEKPSVISPHASGKTALGLRQEALNTRRYGYAARSKIGQQNAADHREDRFSAAARTAFAARHETLAALSEVPDRIARTRGRIFSALLGGALDAAFERAAHQFARAKADGEREREDDAAEEYAEGEFNDGAADFKML